MFIRWICLLLRRFDFSRKAEAGELEARETGNEHARDHGKEKGERRNACDNSVDFSAILSFSLAFSPSLGPLRALLFLEKKRDVWERGSRWIVIYPRVDSVIHAPFEQAKTCSVLRKPTNAGKPSIKTMAVQISILPIKNALRSSCFDGSCGILWRTSLQL